MQKFKFSIYVNTNVIQGLVCKKKPRVLFFSKAHNQACKHVNCMRKFSIFKCTRGSLMIQFTNTDIGKNMHYIFTQNKMLVIRKWSSKYTNKSSITKHALKVRKTSYLCSISFAKSYTDYRSRETMTTK